MRSIKSSEKNNKSKYAVLTQNMALFAICSFGSKLILFLMVPLYTYVLNTEEYGTVDLLTATVSLLIPVLTVNVQDAVLRFTLDREHRAESVISIGIRINAVGALILLGALLLLCSTGILRMDTSLVVFLFFSYVLGGLNNCFTLYLKGRDRVPVLVVSGLLNTLLLCVLNILFLVVLKLGIRGYLIANISGMAAAVVCEFFAGKIFREIKFKRDRELTEAMLSYSRPLIVNSLAWWINNASDRYILTYISGAAANGIYSVAYKIPTILSSVQEVFYNAWSISAITEYDEEDRDGFVGNMYTMYSVVSIAVCSLILLANIPLARMLYSKDFFAAWRYVPFLLVGTMFNGLALFMGCIFSAAKKTGEVSRTTMAGAAVNTICNFFFIYWIGAIGAALATLLGYLVTWGMRLYRAKRIIHMKVEWKRHFFSCFLLIVQAVLAINEKTWYAQGIAVVLIFILQRKHVSDFLRKLLHHGI